MKPSIIPIQDLPDGYTLVISAELEGFQANTVTLQVEREMTEAEKVCLDSAYRSQRWANPQEAAADQFRVFTQLMDLSLRLQPDVLLMAGDLFHFYHVQTDTPRPVSDQFARLGSIPVLISPGNHDPYPEYRKMSLPPNVHVFSNRWSCRDLGRGVV